MPSYFSLEGGLKGTWGRLSGSLSVVNLLGARYSGLHPLGSVADHVFLCDDAGIEVLVVHPDFAETGAAVAEQARTVRHLLTLGPAEVGRDLIAACAGMASAPLRG